MSSNPRKKINPTDEARLLMACRRRCCLCAHYKSDYSRKRGQIAHIDRDPSNATKSNLAFLCFECHDEYDSKSSQSKNFTQGELRLCKEKLEDHYTGGQKLQVDITLTLDLTPNELEDKQEEIESTISAAVGREVEALNLQFRDSGIDVTLDSDETHHLVQEAGDGTLGQYPVRVLEIVDVRCESSRQMPLFDARFGDEYLEEFITKERIIETFTYPDRETHFNADGNYCRYDESVLSIFIKQVGAVPRQFAVMVFVLRGASTTERTFNHGIRIYRKEFEYSDSWGAVDYANAFADKYGVMIHQYGKRIILPSDKIQSLQTFDRTISTLTFRAPYHYIGMQKKDFLGVTHIYFMLVVDIMEYARCLHRHGMRPPRTFKKKLRTRDQYRYNL